MVKAKDQERNVLLKWFNSRGVDASSFTLGQMRRVRKAYKEQMGQKRDRQLIRDYFRI